MEYKTRQEICIKQTWLQAFERFSEDISPDDDDHLDLPLLQEENLLNEYKRFLDM